MKQYYQTHVSAWPRHTVTRWPAAAKTQSTGVGRRDVTAALDKALNSEAAAAGGGHGVVVA